MGQFGSALQPPLNSTQAMGSKQISYPVVYNGAWYGMLGLAGALLVICALLAGLTLAVCGLNMTLLHIRSVTGKPRQRQQALVVARMKRYHSWMLCSLIITSVFCGESLPFVIQSLWNDPKQWWIPIIVSTLSIAFFAEIAPQYWIPRRAIEWGYYCWPLIWGCMWITCVVSWPLAKLLDYFSGGRDEVSIFSNHELAGLIQYHERSGENGGSLDGDTTRIMLGALSLDGHKIGSNFSHFPETRSASSGAKESDLEKVDHGVVHNMIVDWPAVKTVDIDEVVDKAFIRKIGSWSYSRIPVIGDVQIDQTGARNSPRSSRDTKRVYGVLHVKNLIGVKAPDKHDTKAVGLRVRDLQLYPLPIVVDDMPTHSLLNIFHSGISRMAVVISSPARTSVGEIVIPKNAIEPDNFNFQAWTGTERTNRRINSRLKELSTNTPKNFLDGALVGIGSKRHNIAGIKCPIPLGIITFEDIIDTILQKKSRDERDFYDHGSSYGTTSKNPVDYDTISTLRQMVLNPPSESTAVPAYVPERHSSILPSIDNKGLRKRNPSNQVTAMDGADERRVDLIEDTKDRREYSASSYTQNSQGGFHEMHKSPETNHISQIPAPILERSDLVEPSASINSNLLPKTASSLPNRKEASSFLPRAFNPFARRYVSAMPDLPTPRRVNPFSGVENSSSIEKLDAKEYERKFAADQEELELKMPKPQMLDAHSGCSVSGINISDVGMESSRGFHDTRVVLGAKRSTHGDSGDTISIDSWCLEQPEYDSDDWQIQVCSNPNTTSTMRDSTHGDRVLLAQGQNTNYSDIMTYPVVMDAHISLGAEDAIAKRDLTYGGFPPELLERTSENRVPDFASMTLPRTMGTAGLDENESWGSDAHVRDGSFHDDRALLPSQRRALYGSAGTMLGERRTSFWF